MTTTCTVCAAKTSAFLCNTCTRQLTDAFDALPALVNEILTAMTRQARVYRSTSRRRQPDPDWRGSDHALIATPLPLDVDASDLLHRAGNELTTWARHLAETRGVELPPLTTGPVVTHDVYVTVVRNRWRVHREPRIVRGVQQRTDAALVRWLLEHRDAIRHDEAADQIHAAITKLRDDILAAIDRSPSPLYAGPCHTTSSQPFTEVRGGTIYVQVTEQKCERQLYAWPGAETIKCDGYRVRELGDEGCGAEHTFAEREEWLIDSIEDALIPLETLHAVTRGKRPMISLTWPPHATVRSWRFRGRLAVRHLDHGGRELFRGGDVLDLVRDWNERQTEPAPRRDQART